MTTPGNKTRLDRGALDSAAAEAPAEAPRWRAWSVQVALVASSAVLLYYGLASWSDAGQVLEVLRRFPPRAAAVVGALVLTGLALRAVRWHLYTRVLGLGLPAAPSVLAFVAGFAFTATPGKVGEVVKSFLLKRSFGVPVAQTAASLLVERVTDLLAMLVLVVVGLAGAGVPGGRLPPGQRSTTGVSGERAAAAGSAVGWGLGGSTGWLLALSSLALAVALVFLLNTRLQRLMLARLARVPRLEGLARRLPALLDSSRRLLTPLALVGGLALAIAAWSCEALALHHILGALGPGVSRPAAFFAFATSSLLGVLSMLPGGLGGFEATMVLFLGRLDVPATTAVAATLLFRLGTLWLVSLLGLVVLGGWVLFYDRLGARAAPGSR